MLFTIWHSQNELGQLDGVLTCQNRYKERLAVQQEDGSDYSKKTKYSIYICALSKLSN